MPSQDNPIAPSRSARIASALLFAFVFLWCVYWFVHAWHYWEDDAYIHLEFARNLAAGHGFAFNGRVVAGDTSPLWVILLATCHALIPNWLVAGKLLTVLGVLLGLTGAFAFARRFATSILPPGIAAEIFPAALLLLIVVNPYFCYWAFSGMESVAAFGLAFFAVLIATQKRPSVPTFLAASLLAGIAPLLRPEMFFLSALLILPLIGQWYRLPAQLPSPSKLITLVSGMLLLTAPVFIWSLYSLRAFEHLLPNTNAAKRASPADSVLLHLLSIYSVGLPLIFCGLIAGVVYLLMRPSVVGRSLRSAVSSAFQPPPEPLSAISPHIHTLSFASWIFILWPSIATLFYIADHTYVQTRYILVTAPGLTIVILLIAISLSPRTGRILYFVALTAALAISIVTVRPFVRNKALNCQTTHDLALYIRDHIPPDAPVADYSIGQIAFDSQHPILDISGITRPGAISYLNAPPQAMVQWARSQGAQYWIGVQPTPDAILVHSAAASYVGWSLHPALYETPFHLELWKLPPSPTLNR